MLVRDVAASAAEELGRDDLAAALRAGETEGEAASLVAAYNFVENELALDHFPLKAEETHTPIGGKILYTVFAHPPVRIFNVYGEDGKQAKYDMYPTCLVLKDFAGPARVEYAYAPARKSAGDKAECAAAVSERLLALGVAREFSLSRGKYEEANFWHGRFEEALRAAGSPRRGLRIRGRRWE